MGDKTIYTASAPFPGSQTPGWNDPPPLEHNIRQTSERPRLNLSKRVAFPVGCVPAAISNVEDPKPVAIVPPNKIILPPTSSSKSVAGTESHTGKDKLPDDTLTFALNILRERAKYIQESSKLRLEDIHRRLEIIEELWSSNGLTATVQLKIYKIAQAISKNDYDGAMENYTELVINHSEECIRWAIALRHIVLTIQTDCRDEVLKNVSTPDTTTAIT